MRKLAPSLPICPRGALDGVGDVMQLEVDENLLAVRGQPFGERQAAGVCQFHADLVEGHAVAKPRDHCFRFAQRWQVERDDQAVAGTEVFAHLTFLGSIHTRPARSNHANPYPFNMIVFRGPGPTFPDHARVICCATSISCVTIARSASLSALCFKRSASSYA